MKDWPIFQYAVCPSCGRFHLDSSNLGEKCQVCGAPLFARQRLQGQFIKPEFGFVASEGTRASGEIRPRKLYASRVHFAEYAPLSAGTAPEMDFASAIALSGRQVGIQQRYSRFGRLVLVNAGSNGRGFEICQVCGFAKAAPAARAIGARPPRAGTKKTAHKHPQTGRDCSGSMRTFHLGHDFLTDVIELRFNGPVASTEDEHLWRSLVYALLEGAAQGLGIRRDDLDGTLYRYTKGAPPAIVLYDNVPGGAGHVHYIAQQLPTVFETAYRRVRHDCCGPETSCYECLRNYRNQPYHDLLQRGKVRDFLAILMAQVKTP